jgi:hypothetical protein
LRRLPSQRADRRRGVREAEKLIDAGAGQTADGSIGGERQRPARVGGRGGRSRAQGGQGKPGYRQPG